MGEWPSQAVNDFRGRRLPEPATPCGYAALIDAYDLSLPLPPRLAAIAERHHPGAPHGNGHGRSTSTGLLQLAARPPEREGGLPIALEARIARPGGEPWVAASGGKSERGNLSIRARHRVP